MAASGRVQWISIPALVAVLLLLAKLPAAQEDILIELYKDLGGPGWKNATGWGSDAPLCNWFGVSCDIVGGITGLSLGGNNLTGTLGDPLLSLTVLELLDLSNNRLNGSLDNIGVLSNLQFVYVNNNNFTGSVPELTSLTKLIQLQMQFNSLTGTIPDVSILTSLNVMSMANNRLSGSLPTGLSALARLVVLDLHGNQLEGGISDDVAQLRHLTDINLSWNNLSGTIPTVWMPGEDRADDPGSLNLQSILLNDNQLTGTIPGQMQAVFVDVSSNQLHGALPDFRWACFSGSRVRLFNASGNQQLRGGVPEPLGISYEMTDNHKRCPALSCAKSPIMIFVPRTYNETVLHCTCDTGYFGIPGVDNNCFECDQKADGCVCNGDVIQYCWPVLSADNTTTLNLLPCTQQDTSSSCNPNGVGFLQEGWCAEGYTNRMCTQCSSDYFLLGRQCVHCLSQAGSVIYAMAVLGFIAACLTSLVVLSGDNVTGIIKIYAFYVQTVGFLFADRLPLLSYANHALQLLTNTTILSITSIHMECIARISVVTRFLLDQGMPLFYMIMVGLAYRFGLWYAAWSGKLLHLWRERCLNMLAALMVLYYFPCCLFNLRSMSCTLYDKGDQAYYLNYQPWIRCTLEDRNYRLLLASSLFGMVFWVIGTPIFFFIRLKRMYHRLALEGASTEFAMIVACYKPEKSWWEGVVTIRRLSLAMAIALPCYTADPVYQFLPVVLLLALALHLQLQYQPFNSSLLNRMEAWCLATLLVTLVTGVFISNFYTDTTDEAVSIIVMLLSLPLATWFLGLFLLVTIYKRCLQPYVKQEDSDEETASMRVNNIA